MQPPLKSRHSSGDATGHALSRNTKQYSLYLYIKKYTNATRS